MAFGAESVQIASLIAISDLLHTDFVRRERSTIFSREKFRIQLSSEVSDELPPKLSMDVMQSSNASLPCEEMYRTCLHAFRRIRNDERQGEPRGKKSVVAVLVTYCRYSTAAIVQKRRLGVVFHDIGAEWVDAPTWTRMDHVPISL